MPGNTGKSNGILINIIFMLVSDHTSGMQQPVHVSVRITIITVINCIRQIYIYCNSGQIHRKTGQTIVSK